MRFSILCLLLAASGTVSLTGTTYAGWDDQPMADLDPPKGRRAAPTNGKYVIYESSYKGERRVRQPGVEAAAQIVLKKPEYRKFYRSAALCRAKDAALEAIADGRSPKLDEAEAARLTEALKKDGIEPLACEMPEVALTRSCIFNSPLPKWCPFNYRIDAFVRAWEIETDERKK